MFDKEGSLLWKTGTGDYGTYATPPLADTDGDGKLEMIFPSYTGKIIALDDDGSILWQVATGSGGTQALIADITGDGKLEVLAGGGGKTWLLDAATGTELWRLDYALLGYAPAAVDLTGDGKLEVLFNTSSPNKVIAVRSDGTVLWESTAMTQFSQSPVVLLGDVTGDGVPDIAVGARDKKIYAFSGADGSKLWDYTAVGRCFGVATADLNRDGIPDVVATATKGDGVESYVYVLSGADGSLLWQANIVGRRAYTTEGSPSIADVDGDGVPDVLVPGTAGYLYALSGVDGSLIWEISIGSPDVRAAAIADLTGDGSMEIVVGAGKWLRVFTGLDVTIVYVDDAWVGLPHGTEVEPGKYVGGNAFGIITEGLDGVRTGGVVQVLPGTYTERLTIAEPVMVVGGDPNDRPLVDLPDGDNAGITILASNVSLEGLDIRKLDSAGWSNTIILVDRGGSWLPGYEIVHDGITFRDLLIEGGRRGMMLTASNLTIEDCVFDGQIRDAIYLNAVSGVTRIVGNTFLGAQDSKKAILFENFSSNDPGVSGTIWITGNTSVGKNNFLVYNQWLHLDETATLRIIGNVIRDPGSTAIDIYNLAPELNVGKLDAVEVWLNAFHGIPEGSYAVRNRSTDVEINAALNWWGSSEGPTHASNPAGAGHAVSDNVIYSPWLGLDPDGNPLTPGVQIADPLYIIVAPVGPPPAGGHLNMAIDGSNMVPGVGAHTIEVRHGMYDASAPITNPVSIISEAGSAAHTFLTGDMAVASSYVVLGRLGQGFTVLGSITVPPGTDASTIAANWNNLLGLVVNAGNGALDATLNYWGDPDGPAAAEVTGLVAYSPWLGLPADDTPMVLVVAPVGAQPAAGYLNTAIAAANTLPGAETIEVKHGAYDGSTPITSPVNIRSEPGSASHTTLTGAMSIKSGGVLIGGPLQGFRILGDVTVGELIDAASSKINWSDLYGSVTNKGTGTFDAKYNFWGTQEYAVIDARTIGDIAVDPYLPKNADDSYNDVVVLINAGMVGSVDGAIQQLWAMDQLGQDVDTFIDYQGVAGAGAFQSLPPGSQITVGGAGGGGGLETTIAGTYAVGDIIDGRFVLTDPITGLPVEDALVTVSLLGPAGSALAFWGVTTYDASTGEYVFQIDTSGLAPGSYEMIIQTADGQTETLTIEIVEP